MRNYWIDLSNKDNLNHLLEFFRKHMIGCNIDDVTDNINCGHYNTLYCLDYPDEYFAIKKWPELVLSFKDFIIIGVDLLEILAYE